MNPLWKRLTEQLTAQGGITDPQALAKELLIQRGHMDAEGGLTATGKERDALGASGRAIDRAVKRSGRAPRQYEYDEKTNRATLKKGLKLK